MNNITFNHVRRLVNSVAHALAKVMSSQTDLDIRTGEPPNVIRYLIMSY